MYHPFHPQHALSPLHGEGIRPCNACGKDIYNGDYSCSSCSFYLHHTCFLLEPITRNSEVGQDHHKIQQTNHPHPLILCDNKDKTFPPKCSCCNFRFTADGAPAASVYVCLECKVLLHKYCADLPLQITHPFHPSHPLILSRSPNAGKPYICNTCSKEGNGFFYHCSNCDFDLDVYCASWRPTTNIEGEGEGEGGGQIQIQHEFIHPHSLIPCSTTSQQNLPPHCNACWQPLVDSMNYYYCPECELLMCKSCADLPQKIDLPIHAQSPLTIRYRRGLDIIPSCMACLYPVGIISFECSHSHCDMCMDIGCALSKFTTMMSVLHDHPLAFVNKQSQRIRCNSCFKSCIDTPFFRCAWCNFTLHVYCISLPPTIKSKSHRHLLTLANFEIKDHPDQDLEDAEFYCNVCEGRRKIFHPSYYCEECPFIAHPHCVAFEIMSLLEKEWSKQQCHAKVDEVVEEQPALTLKEFLDSFKEDENKEVRRVFKAYRRFQLGFGYTDDKDGRDDSDDDNLPKVSVPLNYGFIEIMEIIASENPVLEMPWENRDSWEENCKSIFMSKVVKVGEYMIPENWAPILEALFAKDQCFSGWSKLSSKAKNFCLIILCDAIQSMGNTKVVDITMNQVLCWLHSFMLWVYAGFKIQYAINHFVKAAGIYLCLLHDDIEIAKQGEEAPVDSKELTVRETKDLVTIAKLDEEIEELEKRIKAMGKILKGKRALRELRAENSTELPLELEGLMAGTDLFDDN